MPARFEKPHPELVQLFDEQLAVLPADRRVMFGCPCGFSRGNMFCGLFGQRLFVRLAEEDRAALLSHEGAELFDPMGGRPMREYVVVPHGMLDEPRELAGWLERALSFALALPAKGPKKSAAKPGAAKAKAGRPKASPKRR